MSIIHAIDSEMGVVLSTWVGIISDSDLLSSYKELFEGELWQPGYDGILDLRSARLNLVTDKGLYNLHLLVKSHTEGQCDEFNSILIASDDLVRELVAKFESFSDDELHKLTIFADTKEAHKWLRKLRS